MPEAGTIQVKVAVDTSQLDAALKTAREFEEALKRIGAIVQSTDAPADGGKIAVSLRTVGPKASY